MSNNPVARRRPRAHDGQTKAEVAVFAATEELLTESSLQDITVAQIIARAGVSRANFYHYFASKYDVLIAMLSRFLEETYSEGPWQAELGKSRARAMDKTLRRTIEMWSEHGAVICAAIEHMHSEPALAAAWNSTLEKFVSAIAEQITYERANGNAPEGFPADTIAAMLVCALQRTFYVGTRGLDARLPKPESAVDSIIELVFAAIYGAQRPKSRLRRRPRAERVKAPAQMAQSPEASDNETPLPEGDPGTAAVILDATKSLLAEISLDDLSVAKILERSGISRATFYFYFGSKEAAFIALFQEIAASIADGFSALAAMDRSKPAKAGALVQNWLDLDPGSLAVVRNAIHEWPRRPDLRGLYLNTVETMASALESAIETDRALGLALEGPPADELAAVLIWTIERSYAGSLAGEKHLEDAPTVAAMLGNLLVATIYGR
ncbi:TetR/AcrR family transcriptional regulator [Williamsia sp. D3]|uniref:TetR/AcrR family transcriptional regulator n=1 Tax=Williamsia sp. D3 TaxID=1313067 RepID=UPI0004CE80E3|nr:TetR/AcrR family transcriptional regulator [Williamsia sp. D3]